MRAAAIALSVLLAAPALAQDADFDALVEEYYKGLPAAHPVWATDLGLHERDGELDDFSKEGLAKERKRLEEFAARFASVDADKLSPAKQVDLALVRTLIDGSLIDMIVARSPERRADLYTGLANQGVYVLVKRDFADQEVRLKAATERLEKVPALLSSGKKNLKDVPRIVATMVIDEVPGIMGFLNDDVPAAFEKALAAKDAKARFEKARAGAIAALLDYKAFVEKLPTKEDFALGERLFRAKLGAEEMLDDGLDALLEKGERELRRLQDDFKKTAARIDANATWEKVQQDLQKDHATRERVIPETQERLLALRQFLIDRKIVSVPSPVMPRIEETPPFMRATTLASMFTPGPFETRGTDAIYNLTLPDPAWDKARAEEWLGGALNRGTLDLTSIHEAFPGHYVQFLWFKKVPSKVRRIESCASNTEGWAHYCEQMALDEGWGNGDPKLRLAQLQDALLRAARYVVGIRMHARGMSLDEGTRFFKEQGWQSPDVAVVEARRGTVDPTYMYYTWGKLEILRLREDYLSSRKSTLEEFHDAFLEKGGAPLCLVRSLLLGEPVPRVEARIAPKEPPPGFRESTSEPPSPDHAWQGGRWSWRGEGWAWVAGRWVAKRSQFRWSPDRWDPVNGVWLRSSGHWERRYY